MFTLNHKSFLELAAAAGFAILCGAGPASADELLENHGPVGAHEPILTSLGDKRVIAFYRPGSERCALHAVVWDNTDAEATQSAARVRVSLEPGQVVHIDNTDNETLSLLCGKDGKRLSISDDNERVAFGMTDQAPHPVMKAQVSDF